MMELVEATISELQEQMSTGQLTAEALTDGYLERIEALDKNGPALGSILALNPEAQAIARALDRERQAQGSRGPLHGIPIVLKANIDTADQMSITAGSLALEDATAAQDAFLVGKLRQAGAVILGKANLSEWANFRSTRSSSGWSSQGGQTRNPYALDRNPCGSSSGSAVAVAASLCAAAIGTETDGSIICPAQANGIVGCKPTVGLISRAGIIPISHSQDTAGPMARTVADAAILLAVMAGADPADPVTVQDDGDEPVDYTRFLDAHGLLGARLGVARHFFGFDPRVDQIMEAAIGAMKRLGATIVDPVNLEMADQLGEPEIEVLLYEFKADLNHYLSKLAEPFPRSLAEIIAFNEANQERVMPYFGQERMLRAQEKGGLEEPAYQEALAACRRLARDEGLDAALREHQLDAIIAPSGGPAWTTDLINGDHHAGGSSSLAAVAGYPNVTVPAGFVFGLPVGLSFFGGPHQEATLFRLAYAFEQATQIRRPPAYVDTITLS
ncbi:MAG: amidase [Candidatus Promineifilaceae bacterium]|nr:amidase [Candidatus Promineifilaceae bacterium]